MRKISISIPTFNRFQFTVDSFSQVLKDERIDEVVISDDASTDDSYELLWGKFVDHPKVSVYANDKNYDCYKNKQLSVSRSGNEWVILLDSDNVITPEYLDALYAIPEWDSKTIYQPEWAKPAFDFRKWTGLTITKENVAQYANTDLMTSLNACNHFVNRDEYLKVWNGSVNPMSSDSIFFMYCWLNNGGKIYITPNLQYDHKLHEDGSNHYNQNSQKTIGFHKELMEKIKQLR